MEFFGKIGSIMWQGPKYWKFIILFYFQLGSNRHVLLLPSLSISIVTGILVGSCSFG